MLRAPYLDNDPDHPLPKKPNPDMSNLLRPLRPAEPSHEVPAPKRPGRKPGSYLTRRGAPAKAKPKQSRGRPKKQSTEKPAAVIKGNIKQARAVLRDR